MDAVQRLLRLQILLPLIMQKIKKRWGQILKEMCIRDSPKAAKGIVKRDVIRVVTPGTNVMTQSLDESKNNFIMSVFCEDDLFGIGVCDLSTGEFRTTQVEHQEMCIRDRIMVMCRFIL